MDQDSSAKSYKYTACDLYDQELRTKNYGIYDDCTRSLINIDIHENILSFASSFLYI